MTSLLTNKSAPFITLFTFDITFINVYIAMLDASFLNFQFTR